MLAPRKSKDLEVVCLSAHIACSVEENWMLTHSYFETLFFYSAKSSACTSVNQFCANKYFIFSKIVYIYI